MPGGIPSLRPSQDREEDACLESQRGWLDGTMGADRKGADSLRGHLGTYFGGLVTHSDEHVLNH